MVEAQLKTERNDEILVRMTLLLEEGYFKENPPALQRLIIAAYGELARGNTVTPDMLSDIMGLDAGEIRKLPGLMPESAIECDNYNGITGISGITGLIGLSIKPSRHELIVDGRTLYTWCAFDALFLPAILDRQALIRSVCPTTSAKIEIELDADAIRSASPVGTVMSIVWPEKDSYRDDLQGAFCCHVNFFRNQSAFDRWAEGRSEVKSVVLDQAFRLARMRNRRRFPDIPRLAAN